MYDCFALSKFMHRDSNVPKFLNDDLPLFNAIVQDLFPGSVIPDADYGILQTEIEVSDQITAQ